ncbi:MAG: serine kinase [Rhodobacteraceae bacterium]|nr:serine kinase [Paracoccaceae bacterium]
MPDDGTILHASCVSVDGKGVLILGRSGSGKSALALALMAFGARLVSDDRTVLHTEGEAIIASAPAAVSGLIEARGLGILHADPDPSAPVVVAVDLDRPETERLPPHHRISLLDREVALIHGHGITSLPSMLLQYLRGGRAA